MTGTILPQLQRRLLLLSAEQILWFVRFLDVVFFTQANTFSTVPFLEVAKYLVEASFDLLQVIIDKLAPLLFKIAFELYPFPIESIYIHGFPLREMALRQCLHLSGIRSCLPILLVSVSDEYG